MNTGPVSTKVYPYTLFILSNIACKLWRMYDYYKILILRNRFLVSYNHSHSMEKTMEYYTLNIVLWNV